MPELPEVESFRKYIDKTSLHKQIVDVKIGAPKMLLDKTPRKLKGALINNEFASTARHGKFLFVKLKRGPSLLLHFGLTGDLLYDVGQDQGPEKFAVHFYFSDDSSLYFTDTRKMGKIALVENVSEFIERRGYGSDALKISESEFLERVGKRKRAIKAVLMDQKVLAGVGNEFSDEILFEARIHPASHALHLKEKQLKKVYSLMVSILKESVNQNANREKLTQYFFLENRKAGLTCPNCKGKTALQTIGGRSSYFCPRCQKLY